jgi:cell division protein FtsZ
LLVQNIINEALKPQDDEKEGRSDLQINEIADESRRIVVIGCGNAGNTIISRLSDLGFSAGETIAVNTDREHLEHTHAGKRLNIGKRLTKGLGAGGFAVVGREAALAASKTLSELIDGAKLVIITAGVGWGTGTGATPVIAEIARDQGAATLAIVTYPFIVELHRQFKVDEGLNGIVSAADTACVLDHNRIHTLIHYLPQQQAFSVMDQLIAEFIIHLCASAAPSSLVPVSFPTLCDIVKHGGYGTLGVAEMKNNPDMGPVIPRFPCFTFLDIDHHNAMQCLLVIVGSEDLSKEQAQTIAAHYRAEIGRDTQFRWCAVKIDGFGPIIRCYALLLGLKAQKSDFISNKMDYIVERMIPIR